MRTRIITVLAVVGASGAFAACGDKNNTEAACNNYYECMVAAAEEVDGAELPSRDMLCQAFEAYDRFLDSGYAPRDCERALRSYFDCMANVTCDEIRNDDACVAELEGVDGCGT